uniref:Uncharacterized protein n=2 Tax=Timema TaxID=61471 RepID=A0A7R9FHF1_9NEOP|nr:unnamed protein product [Timema bartmani]CAD7453555.1 unnamed protein product [Timema tahoe]
MFIINTFTIISTSPVSFTYVATGSHARTLDSLDTLPTPGHASLDMPPLYVQSEIPQIDTQLGASGHASVRLSSVLNTYCRWRVLYWDPNMRLETEGCPFPPHCRVIVNHASSNKNLSVEPCHWFPSYFGMECQVSVHTYRDVHRRETSENMWMFITQKPTDPQLVKPSD